MAAISSKSIIDVQNQFKYNGHELQNREFSDKSGLQLYDYSARMQDPQLGRFWQIDPKCEILPNQSTYNYCFNNPLLFVDPDGMLAKYCKDDGKYYDEEQGGKEVSWDEVKHQYNIGEYATSTSVLVAPENDENGNVKYDYDYEKNTLKHLISFASELGTLTILRVRDEYDAADKIEQISAMISNLFIASHGDASDLGQAYFGIGSKFFHVGDVENSPALTRIAKKLASNAGPLPSAAQVIVFACGSGGSYNKGFELMQALSKKMSATVFGPQGFGCVNSNLFKGGSQSDISNAHLPKGFYSNALLYQGLWTKTNNQGTKIVNNVYFDAFGKIHYSQ